MAFLKKTKSLLNKAGMNLVPAIDDVEAKSLHSDLVKVVTQLKATQNIVNNNATVVNELAIGNKDLAGLLSSMNDSDIGNISEKILNKEVISSKEATKLLDSLGTITETVSKIGVSLDVNLQDLVNDFKPLVSDSRVDIESRRKILSDIRDYAKDQGVSEGVLKDLQDINVEQLNFTKKETANVEKVLSRLTKESAGISNKTTLSKLNQDLDSAVLTKDELAEVLEKQTSTGGTFGDTFKKIPEVFSTGAGSQLKSAGLTSGLDAVLPGLGSLLEATGVGDNLSEKLSLKGAKSAVSGGIGSIKNMFSSGESEEKGSNTSQLSEVSESLGTLVDLEEHSQKAEKKQNKKRDKDFDELEKSQKKIARKSGRGKGGIGGLGGLAIGSMLIGALPVIAAGLVAAVITKPLTKLQDKYINDPIIKSVKGIGRISDKYINQPIADFGKGLYDGVKNIFSKKDVDLGGVSTSDRSTKLLNAESKKSDDERTLDIFRKSAGKLELKDGLKTPELSSLEKDKGVQGVDAFALPPTPPRQEQVEQKVAANRKLTIDDPYIAMVNSVWDMG
jgi:hypothetical protein